MKKTELVDIIRNIVKEEVHNALPQLLMEVLAEKITQNSGKLLESEKKPAVAHKAPNIDVKFEEPVKKQPASAPKIYTKNPILNQILNETTGGVPVEQAAPSAIDTLQNLPKEVLAENKDVAAVANALTRDYSQLLKAVDAKAKSKRPV